MNPRVLFTVIACSLIVHPVAAQSRAAAAPPPPNAGGPALAATTAGVPVPPGYVIGPDDVLQLMFWREKDMSVEVSVRPDGMISVPLVNDITAAGLTPEQLREKVMQEARRYTQDASVTIVVKQINSRRVYITGEVTKPGLYSLTGPMTVLQLVSVAGGLKEFADSKNIRIMRTVNGKPTSLRFNYKAVTEGKDLVQNVDLKPGDTVIVP